MRTFILAYLILATAAIAHSQTSETKYYNNEWLTKEVSQDKAKFSQTITQNTDGTVTTEIKDLKENEIVRSETFKGDEPYGIWKFRQGKGFKTVDYNFPLIYSKDKCNDSLPITTVDFFQDNDSLGYKAPKLSTGESSVFQFISRNIIYPSRAKEEGIQGKVYIQLTLTKDGTIEDIVVKRGIHSLLDKEAVRILRQIKFISPPMIHGQAITFKCLVFPIIYRLT